MTAVQHEVDTHCPSWCTVPREEHLEDLRAWEGCAVHLAVVWEDAPRGESVRIGCATSPAGAWDGNMGRPGVMVETCSEPPRLPEDALELAGAIIEAVRLIQREAPRPTGLG
jgi:hypothetical protein